MRKFKKNYLNEFKGDVSIEMQMLRDFTANGGVLKEACIGWSYVDGKEANICLLINGNTECEFFTGLTVQGYRNMLEECHNIIIYPYGGECAITELSL